ncbi:hypothetical protein Tco_1113711 [Tanacetum coccineum]|uniref:Uncharacterized protein n=1 Tax=Tanacetum coccineum TaxID=301880 RepID=A0ABQ5IVM9_9ASTR
MAKQTEANKRMKDQVVELERQINQRLRNNQAIIENLERQFKNENDKSDVAFIKEDAINHIPTMPNPNPINSNSLTVSHFLKDFTMHIPYTNAKTFTDDLLMNHVGDKELKYVDGVKIIVLIKKKIKKNDNGVPKELNKEWKRNEKVVPHNKDVYHYLWHPTEISHLDRIIKES